MPYKDGVWYPYDYFDRKTPLGESQYDRDRKEQRDRDLDPCRWDWGCN